MVSEVCRGVQRGVPSTRQIFTFGGDFVNTQVLSDYSTHSPVPLCADVWGCIKTCEASLDLQIHRHRTRERLIRCTVVLCAPPIVATLGQSWYILPNRGVPYARSFLPSSGRYLRGITAQQQQARAAGHNHALHCNYLAVRNRA